jgi:exonuclease III
MNLAELQLINIDSYKLGANHCRTRHEKGGVCIYVQKNLKYVKIDLDEYCKDKDFEACAIKLNTGSKRFCITTIYRDPTGNFDVFITKLDIILRKLYNSSQEHIICGDININYL